MPQPPKDSSPQHQEPRAPSFVPDGLITRPSLAMLVRELRWVKELVQHLSTSPAGLHGGLPQGDRRPILVIPGFLCSDLSTWALRRFLRRSGYRVYRWRQGTNWGQRPGVRVRLLRRLHEIKQKTGEPVTLIGWSLGGVYARELACIRPDFVREVITLGTPWNGSPALTSVWQLYQRFNRASIAAGGKVEVECPPTSVPCTSIFSKDDGIVPWQMSQPRRGHPGKRHEVHGSHIGLIANNEVMRVMRRHLSDGDRVRAA